MKKLVFMFVAFAAISFASCDNKTTATDAANDSVKDSTVVVDSAAQDSVVADSAAQDSVKADSVKA